MHVLSQRVGVTKRGLNIIGKTTGLWYSLHSVSTQWLDSSSSLLYTDIVIWSFYCYNMCINHTSYLLLQISLKIMFLNSDRFSLPQLPGCNPIQEMLLIIQQSTQKIRDTVMKGVSPSSTLIHEDIIHTHTHTHTHTRAQNQTKNKSFLCSPR